MGSEAEDPRSKVVAAKWAAGAVVVSAIVAAMAQFFSSPGGGPEEPKEPFVDYVGRVLDAQSEEPIPGAEVEIHTVGIPSQTRTDSKGVFRFQIQNSSLAGLSNIDVSVKHPNYETFTKYLSTKINFDDLDQISLKRKEPSDTANYLKPKGSPTVAPRAQVAPANLEGSLLEPPPALISIHNLTKIPAGPYVVGTDATADKKSIIVDAFYIGTTEVTCGQYDRFCSESGIAGTNGESPDAPVTNINWYDSVKYCRWLTSLCGLGGGTVSLPTESEWEIAARGGMENTRFPWGNSEPTKEEPRANFADSSSELILASKEINDGFPQISPVESYESNRFGLFDIIGNVWEWCNTEFSTGEMLTTETIMPNDHEKDAAIRGGSWKTSFRDLSCSLRGGQNMKNGRDDIGFRIVWHPNRDTI